MLQGQTKSDTVVTFNERIYKLSGKDSDSKRFFDYYSV